MKDGIVKFKTKGTETVGEITVTAFRGQIAIGQLDELLAVIVDIENIDSLIDCLKEAREFLTDENYMQKVLN